jgi:hypothetical protein
VPIPPWGQSGEPESEDGALSSLSTTERELAKGDNKERLLSSAELRRHPTAGYPCGSTTPSGSLTAQAYGFAASINRIVFDLVPILGSPGEQYLREQRKIDTSAIEDVLGATHAIGWHPKVLFNEPGHSLHGRDLGCIVGVMTDPLTAEPTGAISRTYLDSDLRKIGKAKSLGEGGGIVRLSPDQGVLEGLFVAEGIETALTVMALGLRPVWSTGSGTIMAKFSVIAGIEALTILADNDASGAGERAAREVEARWRQAGKEVRIIMRDKVGDINDALKGQAAIALSPEENLILLGMREMQTLELLSEAAPISEDKPDFGGPAQEASLSRSRRFIDVRAIDGGGYPVEDPTQMSHRAKLSGRRRHHGASDAPQQTPLSFADPPTLAKALDGGPHGRRQWMGHCPCHPDREASLSIRWGRNGGTVAKCHAGCKQEDLLAAVHRLGFGLDREPPRKAKYPRRPAPVSTSIAFIACNLSERRMFDLLQSEMTKNPDGAVRVTYNQFCGAGVRRSSISPGLRAMETLGLITVQRAPFNTRERRYDTNLYKLVERWRAFEPKNGSPKARKATLAYAREVAANARKSEKGA